MATGDKVYIADKQTLDDIKAKVGSTNDTGGSATSGSIFAKINSLISTFASHVAGWTAARAAKMDNLDVKVSTMQTEEMAATRYTALFNKASEAVTAANNSGVSIKSVQRGVMPATSDLTDVYSIALSTVNPAKCVVSFENRVYSGVNTSFGPLFISLTSNELTVRRPLSSNNDHVQAMWQVVEYY